MRPEQAQKARRAPMRPRQPQRWAPLAQRYIVPLGQHIGAPARPCVEVGQAVLKGQTIALPDGTVSAALILPVVDSVV